MKKSFNFPDLHSSLLRQGDPPVYSTMYVPGNTQFLFTCEHAGNAIPGTLDSLGLDEEQLKLHIAWDIGILEVAKKVSENFKASLFYTHYSRLLIDCNRVPGHLSSIAEVSDRIPVPGNQNLTKQEKEERRLLFFDPFHRAIAAEIQRRKNEKIPTFIVALHSFTPKMRGYSRPWHIGIGYIRKHPLADFLLRAFGKEPDITVGDNQPYDIDKNCEYSLPVYSGQTGFPGILIEVRQDQLIYQKGQEIMAERLTAAFRSFIKSTAV